MKWFVILFAAYFGMLSIAPNFQGAQLLNISSLIEHYRSDINQSNNNFYSFLVDHYANSSSHSDKRHESLPFKSVNTYGASILIYVPNNNAISVSLSPNELRKETGCYNYINSYSLQDLSDVFHPPKLS